MSKLKTTLNIIPLNEGMEHVQLSALPVDIDVCL